MERVLPSSCGLFPIILFGNSIAVQNCIDPKVDLVASSLSSSKFNMASPMKRTDYQQSFSGQEYFFTEPVPEDLICAVCHELLNETQQTPCGHLFCRQCLEKVESNSKELLLPMNCPKCRAVCSEGVFNDRNTDRRVKNLQITCTNGSCEWKGSLCDLDDHKAGRGCKGCEYEPVPCVLGCEEKIVRINLTDHEEKDCRLRPVVCKHCAWKGMSQALNDHYSTCKEYPVLCPNGCGINISSQNVEDHLQKCPEQKVACPYSNLGCRILTKRKELETHVEASKDQHLKLSLDRVCQLTSIIMERSLDTSNKLCLTTHPWLSNTRSFPSMPWIIRLDDFAKKKVAGVEWISDPFFTTQTGYKLCLSVCHDGDGKEYKGYISVFVVLQRGPNDDILSWPLDKTVIVTLLNQLEDRFHYVNTIRFGNASEEITQIKPGAQSATGWGKKKFIPHTDLSKSQSKNCQYLKDDCLFCKIELQ